MTCWHLIWLDHPDLHEYALCAHSSGNVICKKIPAGGSFEEPFLWARVGSALINKASGKVLEASAELNKPVLVRCSSNPLRRSQSWNLQRETFALVSLNSRVLHLGGYADRSLECRVVLGASVELIKSPGYFRWKFKSVPQTDVAEVPISLPYRTTGPVSKIPPTMQISRRTETVVEFRGALPGDGDIDMRDLLFRADFCKENNVEYQSMNDDDMKKEWDKNGIRLGRWGSPVFSAKFYLEHNPKLREVIQGDNYIGATEYFLSHCNEPLQTSECFDWTIYQQNYPELKHLTPKQLFYHFYHDGYDKHKVGV